jgi:hypothetical protein
MSSRLNTRISSITSSLFILCQLSTAFSQTAAVGTLDRDKVTAGEKFHLKVRLAEAPSFATYLNVFFDYKPVTGITPPTSPLVIVCQGQVAAGNTEVASECSVPIDADGGIYTARPTSHLGPRPGATRESYPKITAPDFEVLAVPDTTIYPKSAVASILLNQKQILVSGAAKIEALLDQMNTKVDNNSAEIPPVRTYLRTVAREGQAQLEKSRSEYRETLQNGSAEPIVFEDFWRRYVAMIVEIRAPQDAHLDKGYMNSPRLETVQLSTKDTVTVHPTPLDGNIGPLVSKLATLLGDHMSAFLKVAESGSTTFTISLKSSPPGATVSYKRLGEQYQDLSPLTDLPPTPFPYALWTFRFKMGNCEVVKTPNPYIEKSPNLNPSMQNCEKK